MTSRPAVLAAIASGKPAAGPTTVHVDITNGCNAACVTCWDHSPLLESPKPASWKQRSLPLETFAELIAELASLGSVESLILSGMGEPLVHRDVYEMIALAKAQSWHLTMLTNLVNADIEQLAGSGIDQLLVGVHGVTAATYAAFHPGWTERQFNTLCRHLRQLGRAGVRTRHVHVICRDNARELADMVRFGKLFRAQRVSYKLASLAAGTEACTATGEQREWLANEGVAEARTIAGELGVATNLDLFEAQLDAAAGQPLATAPIADVGCFMGHLYCRITAEGEVLYCCNSAVKVGRLDEASFGELWRGERWQALRDRLRSGRYLAGCERCGKLEQNMKWSERVRSELGERLWADATGQQQCQRASKPVRLAVLP